MPLWFLPALLGLFILVSLAAGVWLMLHLRDIARIFQGDRPGELAPGPGRRHAGKAAVWAVLLIFNGGWIASVLLWVFVMSGEANTVVNAAG